MVFFWCFTSHCRLTGTGGRSEVTCIDGVPFFPSHMHPDFWFDNLGVCFFCIKAPEAMRSEGHIHLFSRAEKLVGRLETAEHPAQEPPTYCLCSRRRIKCTQREVVFISGMKVQWRMCVTIAACWWGSRFIVSAAWPVEPVIKSNVWWVPHSSPWLQNQLNGSIYFIYWINSILLCNRAHS